MTPTSTADEVTPQSSRSADIELEPRKKVSCGGKRSVARLNKSQLAQKRASDRQAQRKTRQRTKQSIENLEKRNQELEAEVKKLKSQVSASHSVSPQISSDIAGLEDLQPENKLEEPNANDLLSMAMTQSKYDTQNLALQSSSMGNGQDLNTTLAIPNWDVPVVLGQQLQPAGMLSINVQYTIVPPILYY